VQRAGAGIIATAWCVLTGPPSAGKTSVLAALAARGHRIIGETARAHIVAGGKRPAEIAADPLLQAEMQHAIADRQHAVERDLHPDAPLFLDRALPDSIGYFRGLDLPVDTLLERARRRRYRHVFYLDGLPLTRDGLRFEDADEAASLGARILDAYQTLGYRPVRVPAFADLGVEASIARRVELILRHIGGGEARSE